MKPSQVLLAIDAWWRPLTGLLCLPAAPYILWVGYLIGRPVPFAGAAFGLIFVAYLYSFKGWEKMAQYAKVLTAAAGPGSGTAEFVDANGVSTSATVTNGESF